MTPTPLQKTLCNGLLYGLKMLFEKSGRWIILSGISFNENGNMIFHDITGEKYLQKHWNFKPILFSLDMLDKEIEINGERFVPIEKFYQSKKELINQLHNEELPIAAFSLLIQMHFNAFSLPEDQYIQANDKFNPY